MVRLSLALALLGCSAEIPGNDKPPNNPDAPPPSVDAAIDAPPIDARPCTGGEMNTTAEGTCLMLFTTTRRFWADAQAACVAIDAHLAILDTAAKHSAAKILAGMNDTWIGLSDRTTENTFQWVNPAVPYAFNAWDPMEPNNGNGSYEEDCVIIAGARAGNWDDRPCSDQVAGVTAGCCSYAYLCQF